MKSTQLIPTEEQEMLTLCDWLRIHHVLYHHSPNEGQRKVQYLRKLLRLGMQPGFPDVIILDPTPIGDWCGVAIELKRRRDGVVSRSQRWWLEQLEQRGWYATVCRGAEAAIMLLTELGYGKWPKEGGSQMLGEIRPILEGLLYAWSQYAAEIPAAPVTSYERVPDRRSYTPSQQETWVIRWQHVLHDVKEVERILANLSPQQRQLVRMRYQERCTWDSIAEALNVSQRQAFRIRDEVLSIFAYEFGMLNTGSLYAERHVINA